MKSKLIKIVLFLPLLACLMGATIAFDAGQPNPNPGGMANFVEGKGTFTLGANEKLDGITFRATDTKSGQQVQQPKTTVDMTKMTWDATLKLVPGNYDIESIMFYKNAIGTSMFAVTGVVNKNVK